MATVTVSITSEDSEKTITGITSTQGEGASKVKVVDIKVQNGRGGPKEVGVYAVSELKDFVKSL